MAEAVPLTISEEPDRGNFAAIYSQQAQRAEFVEFLSNVFHLYPEQELDALIADCVGVDPRDPAVYRRLVRRLGGIEPTLGLFRYSLPALSKQKNEMARQTQQLLGADFQVRGYLEIGSHGRYLHALRKKLDIEGPIFTCATDAPTHSIVDVVDRGQFTFAGQALALADYKPLAQSVVEPGSLDLITVYIGFHHAAFEARVPYLQSLARALSSRGRLVVRDHDVTSEAMSHLVGLAHDVFNAGTGESWSVNRNERRNFYSLEFLSSLLEKEGFVAQPGRLLQAGDPTENTLMAFAKA